MNTQLLQVAVPVPLHRLFDYLPPKGTPTSHCQPGMRVRVPFGKTQKIAVILATVAKSDVPHHKLRAATSLLDAEPLLNTQDLAFLQWTAQYYHHPQGEVISAALPLRLRKQGKILPLHKQVCYLHMGADAAQQAVIRAPKQQAILQYLLSVKSDVDVQHLRTEFGNISDVLQRMCAKGIVQLRNAEPNIPISQTPSSPKHPLNPQQLAAVKTVCTDLTRFNTFLLDGVTGSGKTEVYLQLAQRVVQQQRSVMLLVPEISLTPQLQNHFRQCLGDNVEVMHSNLSANERELAWQRVRLGLSRVVLGTRSLVFNPVDNLGLIIVDEEHDSSFKQQDGLRYSARDLAVIRAQRAGCPIILGSATPSLESLRNAQTGRYQHLCMPARAGKAKAPTIDLLDVRDQPLQAGLSPVLLNAIKDTLAANQQAMVFINRRGYAPVLACYSCNWVSDCHRCDARQTVHHKAQLLCCHHCGSQRPLPVHCPGCGAADLHPLGQGTEQIETHLSQQFPDVPLLRIDRDATARKGSLEKLLQQIHDVESALLVGTQMLAKGHHFPRVTLVGVLDIDGGLFSADFRGAERMAQLLMQVAGRAGRGEQPGRVLVQTRYPENPLLHSLIREGYSAFAQAALSERQSAGYPPYSYQALLRAEANKAASAEQFLQHVRHLLAQDKQVQNVELWGPVPAPMARRIGKYRAHLLLQASQREALHSALNSFQQQLEKIPEKNRVRWSLDIDPLDAY